MRGQVRDSLRDSLRAASSASGRFAAAMRIALALVVGLALGFSAGWLAFERPWDSGSVSLTQAEHAVAQQTNVDRADVTCERAVAQDDTILCDDGLAVVKTDGDRIVSVSVASGNITLGGG